MLKHNLGKIAIILCIIMFSSLILAGITVAVGGVYSTLISFSGDLIKKNINIDKSFDLATLKNIDADTISYPVSIVSSKSDKIQVKIIGTAYLSRTNPSSMLSVDISDGHLKILAKQKAIFFNFGQYYNDIKINISVPQKYCGDINVNTISGLLSISDLSIGNLNFKTMSGSLTADSLKTKNTVFNSMSGEMNVKNFTGNVDFDSMSGAIYVSYSDFRNDISVNTMSGYSTVLLPSKSQFNVSFKSMSGALTCNFPYAVNTQNTKDSSFSIGYSSNNIIINSMSGGAEILQK
jgi:lia operon protein LiaG